MLKLKVFEVPGSPVINRGILFKMHIEIQKQFSFNVLFCEIAGFIIPSYSMNHCNSSSIITEKALLSIFASLNKVLL